MKALRQKLLRDIATLRWQIVTIAAVVAAGVAMFVAAFGTYRSLLDARADFYAQAAFPDLFVQLARAPDSAADELARIDGVAAVETRLLFDAPLVTSGIGEPGSVRVISLAPEDRTPMTRLLVEAGRMPARGARTEAVVNEAFAKARGLSPGDRIRVLLAGRSEDITIVGTVLSAEHLAAFQGSEIIPDDAHFGIMWLPYDTVASAFYARGTFNDAALRLAPGANERRVMADVDRVLAPHGGYGAMERSEQHAHRFVESELRELEVEATFIPIIFIGVAAFLLNTVLARLVGQERTQIATLRALGVRVAPIARHYAMLAAITAALGSIAGIFGGYGLGVWMTRMYEEFFRFPSLRFSFDPSIVTVAFGATLGAALLGALASVRRIARLAPAEAMQPISPSTLRRGWLERTRTMRFLTPRLRLVARNVLGRPGRTAVSVIGVAAAMAVLVVGAFWGETLEALMDHEFHVVRREDAVITFRDPASDRAVREIGHIPGVRVAEGIRIVPARLSVGLASERIGILGLESSGRLHRLVDARGNTTALAPDGIVLSRHLARKLDATSGTRLAIDVLEGRRAQREVVVAEVVDELVGSSAYMDLDTLERMTGEPRAVSAVLVTLEPGRAGDVHEAVSKMPRVATMIAKDWTIQLFDQFLNAIVIVFSLMLTLFGALLVAGVVYNTARILLAERTRELATLRVVGFTRGDVSEALLLELGAQVVLGLPIGAALGYALCAIAVRMFGPEDMAIPLVVGPRTWVVSLGVVLASAVVSAVLVRRRLDRLDLVAVLKVRE